MKTKIIKHITSEIYQEDKTASRMFRFGSGIYSTTEMNLIAKLMPPNHQIILLCIARTEEEYRAQLEINKRRMKSEPYD